MSLNIPFILSKQLVYDLFESLKNVHKEFLILRYMNYVVVRLLQGNERTIIIKK